MSAEIIQLRSYTIREIPSVLREIARQIEIGEFSGVKNCALVVDGDEMDVCMAGEEGSRAEAYMLLAAGMKKLMQSQYD